MYNLDKFLRCARQFGYSLIDLEVDGMIRLKSSHQAINTAWWHDMSIPTQLRYRAFLWLSKNLFYNKVEEMLKHFTQIARKKKTPSAGPKKGRKVLKHHQTTF